ncbi:MAG: SDR family oxidoreductase [Deltaproteobacteria bacterium]|nr:SDR family oxidoreductase [Deltaproteobacteria bacterium]
MNSIATTPRNHSGADTPDASATSIKFAIETAVVTGGTSGIGRELVNLLASQLGSAVVTCGRNQDAVAALNGNSSNVSATAIDLTERREHFASHEVDANPLLMVCNNAGFEFGRIAARQLGTIKLLVLNAGVSGLNPAEDLRARKGAASLANDWRTSALGTYLACEEALAKAGGTVVFISTPLVHQRQHMENGLPSQIEPYVHMKESIANGLWRLYTRANGPLSGAEGPKVKLMFLEPGSVDTEMHQETLHSDSALASRTLKLREEGRLRDPAIVARIIMRMGAENVVFNHEVLTTGATQPAPAYVDAGRPQKWVHAITDEAYRFEQANLHRPPMDRWWFESEVA